MLIITYYTKFQSSCVIARHWTRAYHVKVIKFGFSWQFLSIFSTFINPWIINILVFTHRETLAIEGSQNKLFPDTPSQCNLLNKRRNHSCWKCKYRSATDQNPKAEILLLQSKSIPSDFHDVFLWYLIWVLISANNWTVLQQLLCKQQ